MVDFIVCGIVFLIVGAAAAFIIKKKKNGAACIGCSCSGSCSKQKSGNGCGQ